MTRSIRGSRRAAVLLAGSAAAALLTSGCGAGQIAQTAAKAPSVPGVNADLNTAAGTYQIRNLLITYKDTKPYPAGANAPLSVAIFNETGKAVTVKVTTDGARSVVLASSGATPIPTQPPATSTPSVGPSPTPSNTLQPSEGATESQSPRATGSPQPVPTVSVQAPSGAPATFRIPAASFVVLNPSVGSFLQLEGLNAALRAGQTVNLTFDFDGKQLTAAAPVSVPLSPAPVAPPVNKDAEGNHGG